MEKKEQGFSIYVNGANVELGRAYSRAKSRSSSRHTKTAGGGMGVLVFLFIVKGHFRVASSLCSKVRLSAKPLIWKLFFYCHANKTHLHNNVFAISLVWKVRVFGTRKWPVAWFMYSQPGYEELFKYSLLQTRLMSCAFSKLQFFNVKGKNTLR